MSVPPEDNFLMTLAVQDQQVTFPAQLTTTTASPHTGRPIRSAESRLNVDEASVDAIRTAAESVGSRGPDGSTWVGEIRSESYVDGNSRHQLHIEWSEEENRVAERVEFQGFQLVPTFYKETVGDEGHLLISFNAMLRGDDIERFRELARAGDQQERYWPVLRVGVSEQPRTMRIGGRLLWSNNDDGSIHQRITLVDQSFDDDPDARNPGLLSLIEPQQPRMMTQLADVTGRLEAIEKVLSDRGLLGAGDLQQIADAGAQKRRTSSHVFFKVDDLADWD